MAIDVESLKSEREQLKTDLRQIEIDQRKLEGDLKSLRQREIRSKREIEALSTLIELHDNTRAEAPAEAAAVPT